MEQMRRTATCGELRRADAGRRVVLNGWVHRKRGHGGISFINLRDRYGITQVTADTADAELLAVCAELRNEFCIAVEGAVRERPGDMVNAAMPTGEIEVAASKIVILNRADVLPFQISAEGDTREELRLRYRYLDLRSSGMQNRIRLRHEAAFAVRAWMSSHGFYEIETPSFIRSTPEGARDYLVPSRLYPGKFYALPQSPQLYKQILMVAGFDRYFQIARCYRDEDARGDRQPEFTQIDIEMSFVNREDVLSMTEGLFAHIFRACLGVELSVPFTRLTWEEAMERYGSDKPDLRFGLELQDFSPWVEQGGFEAFRAALAAGEAARRAAVEKGITIPGGAVKALVVPAALVKTPYSRKQIEELEAHAKIFRAKGLAWMKAAGTAAAPELEGGVGRFFSGSAAEICAGLGAVPGDLILLVADERRITANTALGAVRSKLGRDLGLAAPPASGTETEDAAAWTREKAAQRFAFTWIIDFPLFEYNSEAGHWEAAHHMFSSPQEAYLDTMEEDPGAVKGDLYDLVLNGYELASGSIRIHDPALQKRIFSIVGITPEEAEAKFGFLTEAFKYGAPPHGGIAPGLDRLVMIMAGETSIKEVIAFPKDSFAKNLLDASPSEASAKQLEELHLAVVYPEGT
ncbi:MAG: aspartate--tRNA ligase [Spirochaetaceae bacterium]|jgi:aspartyl-tRNA synthetase|nr:aspartate--tRNA ligase [Spirochaetaceae bacterium]